MHNGAAESLAGVVADVKHRTDNGHSYDYLSNPSDQALVVKFLESIDLNTVPFVPLSLVPSGAYVILSFDSVSGVQYSIEARTNLNGPAAAISGVAGTGARLDIPIPLDSTSRFFRLVSP